MRPVALPSLCVPCCMLVLSARAALGSCASVLVSTCASTPATSSCSICAGQHQHALKVAGCTALDVELYCSGDGGVGHGSGRGFGDGKPALPEDPLLLSGTSWWYDWGLSPSINSSFPQEFVAMAWGAKHQGVPLQRYLAEWTPHHSTKHLLGFNEPNLRHQSNLTATRACQLWPEVLKAASRHGMRVGSPAANHCRPGGGGLQDSNCFQAPMDWFDEFFAQPSCGLDTVDFIATHKYGCNATDTIQYVTELHARYNKPIWLTEFSCSKAPVPKHLAFMKEILPAFDAMPEVIPRYAWFVARAGTAANGPNDALITGDSLNELGRYYNSTDSVEQG